MLGKECENLDEEVVGDDPNCDERNGGRRKKNRCRCHSRDDRVENDGIGQKEKAWGRPGRIAHFYPSPAVGLLSALVYVPSARRLLACLDLRYHNISRP